MRILVTGATGFLGRHIVARLLQEGHCVIAVARDVQKAQRMKWFKDVAFIACDLHRDFAPVLDPKPGIDALIHLAWPGLPNYRDSFHMEKNLPADVGFLTAAVASGIRQISVAGTCLEYGMQFGPLTEEMQTRPTTPYGRAKDALRKSLEDLQQKEPFTLQWARLFYMFGEGQNPGSLLAQLDRAIDEGRPSFDMSGGEQLRDYLPIEAVAAHFARLMKHPQCNGVINCCSGNPISVRRLVEEHCKMRDAAITLNLGVYPYPDYEPLAFWGVLAKLKAIM